MKKIFKLTTIALMSCSAYVYAGEMGVVGDAVSPLTSFFVFEGGYTWNKIQGFDFTTLAPDGRIRSSEKKQGATGRIGAGMMHSFNDNFAVSTEIGYGYYGRTTLNPVLTGFVANVNLPASLVIKQNISGFDALAGVAYLDPEYCYSVFLKAGALVQNVNTNTTAHFFPLGIAALNGSLNQKMNHTGVLPEVKIGGGYYFDNNWALIASYVHAFGASPKTTGTINFANLNSSITINRENPSLNTVLVGVQVVV